MNLNEALNQEQKVWAISQQDHKAYGFTDNVFGGPTATHHTLIQPFHHDTGKVTVPQHINDHLLQHGIHVDSPDDYVKGYATDKYGRKVGLGKMLEKTKAPAEMMSKFVNDPTRRSGTKSNLQVVISRHAGLVGGMSTNQSWTSCMNLNKTKEAQHEIAAGLQDGVHVAYLTGNGDHQAEYPLARIALKRFHSGDHNVLLPDMQYGSGGAAFSDHVRGWTEKNFPLQPKKLYRTDPNTYLDDLHQVAFHNDRETKEHLIEKHGGEHVVQALDQKNILRAFHPTNDREIVKAAFEKGHIGQKTIKMLAMGSGDGDPFARLHYKNMVEKAAPEDRDKVIQGLHDALYDAPSSFRNHFANLPHVREHIAKHPGLRAEYD